MELAFVTENGEATLTLLRARLEHFRRDEARRAGWARPLVSTGLPALDALLPEGGLPCGAVTEILSDGPGVGSMSLALKIAGQCVAPPEQAKAHGCRGEPFVPVDGPPRSRVVILDRDGDLYPPALCRYGMAIDRFIIIRCGNEKDAFWAVDQCLRCPAVAMVITPLRQLEERLSRRLQLAAESSGCVGLILRAAAQRSRTFAAIQMLVEGVPWNEASKCFFPSPFASAESEGRIRLCRVTLLKVREGRPAPPVLVDLNHETGAGPLLPLPLHRSATKLA